MILLISGNPHIYPQTRDTYRLPLKADHVGFILGGGGSRSLNPGRLGFQVWALILGLGFRVCYHYVGFGGQISISKILKIFEILRLRKFENPKEWST